MKPAERGKFGDEILEGCNALEINSIVTESRYRNINFCTEVSLLSPRDVDDVDKTSI